MPDAPAPRLLIVDPDLVARVALSAYFGALGWDVRQAGTVNAALAMIATAPPTHLLIEPDLPDGRGEAVAIIARDLDPSVRVVVLASGLSPGRRDDLAALGANGVFLKPMPPAELARALLGR